MHRTPAMRPPLLAAALLAGCAFHTYAPGSITAAGTLDAPAAQVGCLDVGIAPVMDAEVPVDHPAVRLDLGNRCAHGVSVDFGAVTAQGLYASGWVPLHLQDPRGEVHPVTLDGRAEAHETIEFAPAVPHPHPPSTICLVLGAITSSEAAASSVRRCVSVPMPDDGDPA